MKTVREVIETLDGNMGAESPWVEEVEALTDMCDVMDSVAEALEKLGFPSVAASVRKRIGVSELEKKGGKRE